MTIIKGLILLVVGLGIGSVTWLLFFRDAHQFRRELSQEERRSEIVGAKPLPKAPIEVRIKSKPRSCIVITRAEIDGGKFSGLLVNRCDVADFVSVHWKLLSPDGTILSSDYYYVTTENMERGEQAEFYHSIESDPRASVLVVSASCRKEDYQ